MAVFIFLFVFWLLFNGRITWDVVCFGLVISGLVTWFATSVCGWTKKNSNTILRLSGQLVMYALVAVIEIIKANIQTIKVILNPDKYGLAPRLFCFDCKLYREELQTLMANSITITPGTYTVGIYNNHLLVHALNSEFEIMEMTNVLNLRLMKIQESMDQLPDGKEQEGVSNQ